MASRLLPFARSILVASSLLAASCGDSTTVDGAWSRLDLTVETPTVELSPFANPEHLPFDAVDGFLGGAEVRNLARVPPRQLESFPRQSAGQVRTLRQNVRSRLAWRLRLGDDPFLRFVPLYGEKPCRCSLQVGVRDGEEVVEVFQLRPEPPAHPAPAAVVVPLDRWAGRRIELLFHVTGGPLSDPRRDWATWGSPEVFARGSLPAKPPAQVPNIVLIGIDTLRADHVGVYRAADTRPGAWTSLTPVIDRLAEESDVWLDAYSTFNATNPSFASILTGLYGKNHGVYDLRTPLPAAHTTLAELLRQAGYETLAVISAHHLGPHNSGLGQGFDRVYLAPEHAAAELAIGEAMSWIEGRSGPFFVWLHLFDPHTPHTPPQPYATGFRPVAPAGLGAIDAWRPFRSPKSVLWEQPVLAGHHDLYAGEVAYLDRQLGRLIDFLDSRRLVEQSLIALTSDHGENLGEHEILHRHIGLFETTTRVPLMIRWPGVRRVGRRLPGLVSTVDLFPTLLAAAGLEVPVQDGEDLRRLTDDGRRGHPAVFSEHAGRLGASVRTPSFRYKRSAGNPHVADGVHLFDLSRDPRENRNEAGQGLAIEAELAALLDAWLADRRAGPDAVERELTPEEVERLRALGYL